MHMRHDAAAALFGRRACDKRSPDAAADRRTTEAPRTEWLRQQTAPPLVAKPPIIARMVPRVVLMVVLALAGRVAVAQPCHQPIAPSDERAAFGLAVQLESKAAVFATAR